MRILLSSIYPWIYVLLFLAIPFDNYVRILPNILMGILVVTFPFIIKKEHFKKLNTIPTLLFALFCLYLIGNASLAGRLSEDFIVIKKILLAFGFVLLYIPIDDYKKINRAIVFSALAVITFSVINIFVIINSSEDIVLWLSRQVIEALLIDRIYLGLISILSILISIQAITPKFDPKNKYLLVNIIVNVLFLFLMVSKIAVIVLGILFLIWQLYTERKWFRFLLAFIVIGSITALVLTSTQSGTNNDSSKTFLERTMTWELRTKVWNCVAYIHKSEGLVLQGFGFEGTKDRLVDCYKETILDTNRKNTFMAARYNTHNQFADIYFNWGIGALMLFLVFLTVVFLKNRKEFIPTAFLVVFICYGMVENVFHRQIGAYYVGFVLIVMLIQRQRLENKVEKEP